MTEAVCCYIGVGSNMGNRMEFCREAARKIGSFPGSELKTVSSVYETEPMERTDQDWFLNCVLEILTTLSPDELLKNCQEVEQLLGRKRVIRFGPRTIDIDLLIYGNRIIDEPLLTVPHPRLHQRRFVLEPLSEIAPEFNHPVLHQTPREILSGLDDQKISRVGTLQEAEKS